MFAISTDNSVPFDPWELIPIELRANLTDFKTAVDIALKQAVATGDEANAVFWMNKLGTISQIRARLDERSSNHVKSLIPYREVLVIPNPVDKPIFYR